MNQSKVVSYKVLQDQNEQHVKRLSPSRPSRRLFLSLSISVAAIITIFIAYQLWFTQSINQCGTTSAEARARGCVFEITGFSWLPKDCHDAEIEAEFRLKSKDFQYYRDMNYTQEVSIDEVEKGEGPGFFVKQDYHKAHCAFLFKKLHRAIGSGKKIDGLISPVMHTGHCVHMLLGPPNDREHATQMAFVKFPYCGKDGGYNVEWSRLGEWVG